MLQLSTVCQEQDVSLLVKLKCDVKKMDKVLTAFSIRLDMVVFFSFKFYFKKINLLVW